MSKFLVTCFIIIFSYLLAGCEKVQFNRVSATNKYIWITGAEYIPVSKSIAQQMITEKIDNSIVSTSQAQTDKLGRVIEYKLDNQSAYQVTMGFDYSNVKSHDEVPDVSVSIACSDCVVGFDSYMSDIITQSNTINNTYSNDGKLVTSLINLPGLSFSSKDEYYWNGDLVTRGNSVYDQSGGESNYIYFYFYDSQDRLSRIEKITANLDSGKQENYVTIMTEFNKYGDWIKAEKLEESGVKTHIIRDITYW